MIAHDFRQSPSSYKSIEKVKAMFKHRMNSNLCNDAVRSDFETADITRDEKNLTK